MKIKGIIFDLDGTILDSTWVWRQIDIDFLGKHGFSVPDDYAEAIMAMSFREIAEYTVKRFGLSETPEAVMAEWKEMAKEVYSSKVKLRRGTKEVLRLLQKKGIPVGVATSNHAFLYEPCLRNNGVYEYFHSFTEVDEVGKGKNFPDVYIKAAEKMGCKPEECMVFEDIIPAMESARSGGFITVGVREKAWGYDSGQMRQSCDYELDEIHDAISLINEVE